MSPRLKRILTIVIFVLLVLALLVIVWFLFFQPFIRLTNTTPANTNVTPGQLPTTNVNRPTNVNAGPIATGPGTLPTPSEVANGGLTLVTTISTEIAVAPTLGPDGRNILFYDEIDDRFVRIDPASGTVTAVGTQRFPDVETVTWAPDGERAVLEFPDGSNIVYDFGAQKQYSLPKEAQDFSFSKDSARLAYEFIGSSSDETFLVTAQSNGTGGKAVARLGEKADQVQVAWSPTDEVVGLFRQGTNAQQQEIIFVGQNQENFKSLETDGRGFNGMWTPDGEKLLYTVMSEETNWNPELHLVLARGENIGRGDVNLGLQTPLEKCTYNRAGSHAYCAVPDLLERGSGLYPEFSSNVKDTFYSINLATGAITPIAQPVTGGFERFTVEMLLISGDDSTLYFTDRNTRRLHQIKLR